MANLNAAQLVGLSQVTGAGGNPLITQLATSNQAIAVGAGTAAVAVKTSPGYLAGALVTATAAAALTIYDSASTAAGTVIGVIPSSATLGQFFPFNMPALNGIVAGQIATSVGVTLAYS